MLTIESEKEIGALMLDCIKAEKRKGWQAAQTLWHCGYENICMEHTLTYKDEEEIRDRFSRFIFITDYFTRKGV